MGHLNYPYGQDKMTKLSLSLFFHIQYCAAPIAPDVFLRRGTVGVALFSLKKYY